MCYHYESGLGFRRKRSPRYPNYEGTQTGGNNIPTFGGQNNFPNYGGQNGGNNRPNSGGGGFPSFGGGNFNMFGGGGFPFDQGFPSFDNTNWFPQGASAEGRGALEGVDAVIAESEHGNAKSTGLRVGRGRIMGSGKSMARDSSAN